MKKAGLKFWYSCQENKSKFYPRLVDVIESGFDEILVKVTLPELQANSISANFIEVARRQIVPENRLHDSREKCAEQCVKMLDERRESFILQHNRRMIEIEENIRSLR